MPDPRPISERASVTGVQASLTSALTSPGSSRTSRTDYDPKPASRDCAAPSELTQRLTGIAATTIPRRETDEAGLREGMKAMLTMLLEYPAGVAIAALERWPRTAGGQFFPTLKELYDLCETIRHERRRALDEKTRQDPAIWSLRPYGQTLELMERVRATAGPLSARWLLDRSVFLADRVQPSCWLAFMEYRDKHAQLLEACGVALEDLTYGTHRMARAREAAR